MSENEIKLGELAAVKRLERACMAGGWVAAQIQSDDVQEVLRYIDRLTAELTENEAVINVWRGRTQRAEAERDAAVADAERYRKIEALAAGTPEQWQAVEDAAFTSHWGNVQNFALNIDAIDSARAEENTNG